MKKLLTILLMLSLMLTLAACGGQSAKTEPAPAKATAAPQEEAAPAEEEAAPAAEEDEENYDTGDASLDDSRNQDGIGEQELLVVSFGTSFNDSRRL